MKDLFSWCTRMLSNVVLWRMLQFLWVGVINQIVMRMCACVHVRVNPATQSLHRRIDKRTTVTSCSECSTKKLATKPGKSAPG